MLNTPPTYSIYIAGLVFEWLLEQGGIEAIEKRNIAKAALLYDYLDQSRFYSNSVARGDRSRMNIPFRLADAALDDAFLKGAQQHNMVQLKGHRVVGGMRASIYNAMPVEGVQALVDGLPILLAGGRDPLGAPAEEGGQRRFRKDHEVATMALGLAHQRDHARDSGRTRLLALDRAELGCADCQDSCHGAGAFL